eukprot:scaffold3867_cov160-Isochrysis_galbana.AAC.1
MATGAIVRCCTRVSSWTARHTAARSRGAAAASGSCASQRGTSLTDCSQSGKYLNWGSSPGRSV